MRVKRNKSCWSWPCRKRYCSRLLVTASLKNRLSYVPRTGVYEETRRPASSGKKKGKRNFTALLHVPGNINPRHWVWIYSNKKMFSLSQLQVLNLLLKPALHSDSIRSIFSPNLPSLTFYEPPSPSSEENSLSCMLSQSATVTCAPLQWPHPLGLPDKLSSLWTH